jgi:glycogen synthase
VLKDDLWPHMAAFADRLTEMFTFQQPDVVHAHFWMSAWASAEATRRLGLPLLITFHALGTVKRRYQGTADTSPLNRIRVETAWRRRRTALSPRRARRYASSRT